MAVAVLDAWSGQTAGDPNSAVLGISSASDRVLVVVYFAEKSAPHGFTSITVGGVAPTGSRVETSSVSSITHIWTWYWDEAAIASMSGTTVAFSKTGTQIHHDWDYAVFSDVTGGAEYATSVDETATNSSISATSTTTADDWLIVFVNRESANRDVTDFDNLTEEWQFNTQYTCAVADGAGGDDDVALTGDGISGDWFVQLLHLKSAAAANPMMMRMMQEGHK